MNLPLILEIFRKLQNLISFLNVAESVVESATILLKVQEHLRVESAKLDLSVRKWKGLPELPEAGGGCLSVRGAVKTS